MDSERHLVLQKKHQKSRGQSEAAAIGILLASLSAPLTHGTSLFSLLFTVPKIIYYGTKRVKYSAELRRTGVKPLNRRKRDVIIPVCVGAVNAVIGAGIPGLEHVQHGAEQVFQAVDTQPHQDAGELLVKGIREALQEHYTAIVHPGQVVHDGVQNMWMQGTMDEPLLHHDPSYLATHADPQIASVSMHDIANNPGGIHHLYTGVDETLFELGHDHIENAVERMDELIAEAINGTFTQNEMQAIGKNLTATAIGEMLGSIMEAPFDREPGSKSSMEAEKEQQILRNRFHDIVMSFVADVEHQKDMVKAIRKQGGLGIDLSSLESQTVHQNCSCSACGLGEIVGPMYSCHVGDGDEDIHYCAKCFAKPPNPEFVNSMEWSVYGAFNVSLPIPDPECCICWKRILQHGYLCRDCDNFAVCGPCFKDQGAGLHPTHSFDRL